MLNWEWLCKIIYIYIIESFKGEIKKSQFSYYICNSSNKNTEVSSYCIEERGTRTHNLKNAKFEEVIGVREVVQHLRALIARLDDPGFSLNTDMVAHRCQ